jgi:hypothetical protein
MPLRLSLAALTMIVLSVFAFWPQYLSRIRTAESYTHFHAVLGTCWLLLLVVQPLLVRAAKLALHRFIGRLGCLLGAGFVVSGLLVAHRSLQRMDPEQFAREGQFVYLPLAMTALFAAALVLGIAWRSVPAVHGRFMACTALPLLDPLFARIQFFYLPPLPMPFLYQLPAFALSSVVLLVLSRSLPDDSPGCAGFRSFAVGTVAVLTLYFVVPSTGTWRAFTEWFRALPIT